MRVQLSVHLYFQARFFHIFTEAWMYQPCRLFQYRLQSVTTCHLPSLQPETSAFTFTKAFALNTEVPLLEDHVDTYKAVVLFNLALLYHKKDRQDCDSFEATTLELYNSSLELLRFDDELDCSNLVIAILNNKAQIFFQRNELEETRASLDELGKSLLKALGEGTKALDEQDINGLLLNVHCQTALVCAPGA